MEPYTTSRTLGLSILVRGSNNVSYSLSWVGAGAVRDSWNNFEVNTTTIAGTGLGWGIFTSPNIGTSCRIAVGA
jgi:hypothetical protein